MQIQALLMGYVLSNSWSSSSSGVRTISDCVWTGTQFVAIGAATVGASQPDSKIYTSTDGLVWTQQTTPTGAYPFDGRVIAYGNGTLVVGGANTVDGRGGIAFYSTDNGVTWTRGGFISSIPKSITFGNGTFVVVGDYATDYSTNHGATWTQAPTGQTYLGRSVTFGNNLFVKSTRSTNLSDSTASIFASPDGLTWTQATYSTIGGDLIPVAFGAGVFVCISGQTCYTSANGYNSWVAQPSFANLGIAGCDVLFDGARFVVLGSSNLAYSTDGINWAMYSTTAWVGGGCLAGYAAKVVALNGSSGLCVVRNGSF